MGGAIYAMYIPCIVFAFVFSAYWLFSLLLVANPRLLKIARTNVARLKPQGREARADTMENAHPAAAGDIEEELRTSKWHDDGDPQITKTDDILRRMSTMMQSVNLVWTDLGCSYKTSNGLKTVLQGVCGSIMPRQMMAVLGPSGGGKSTFLDILAGRKTVGFMQGNILVNGKPIKKSFIQRTAYVSQEDNFIPSFTVKETMRMHASLILTQKMGKDEKKQRCEEVLTVMGLSQHQDTLVGGYLPGGILLKGLSGGERKRLSLATGIVALPSVLFLDEPTSGLDSFAALNVMQYMRNITDNGHVVITSIHQPRSAIWSMFDTVLVLSKGHELYFGPREEVVPWFSNILGYPYEPLMHGLPSDWILDLVNIGFDKPRKFFGRTMKKMSDLEIAAQRYKEHYQAVYGMRKRHDARQNDSNVIVVSSPRRSDPESATNGDTSSASDNDSVSMGQPQEPKIDSGFTSSDHARFDRVLVAHEGSRLGGRWQALRSAAEQIAALRQNRASWLTQLTVLTKRQYLVITRNPADVAGRMVVFAGLAILVGLLFYGLGDGLQDLRARLNVAFISMIIFLLLPFVYMSLLTSEKQHYNADLSSKLYRPSAYYIAKQIVSVPFNILNILVFLFIVYGMTGLRLSSLSILGFVLISVLFYLVACQVLDLAATIMPNQDAAFMLAIIWTAIQILFTGFFIRFVDMIHWISYLRYVNAFAFAYQGAIISQFKGQVYSCAEGLAQSMVDLLPRYIQNSTYSGLLGSDFVQNILRHPGADCSVSASSLLDFYDVHYTYATDAIYLICYLIVLHIMTYISFVILSRRENR